LYYNLQYSQSCVDSFADIDPQSLASARFNVAANNLQDRIYVQQALSSSQLLFPLDEGRELDASFSGELPRYFHFTMCNPPFYSSQEEVNKSAQDKELAPYAVCTGADVEMITPGGEAFFVCQIVQGSLQYQTRCGYCQELFV
jgi:23S rRNA A1618 N6-methylase RlmF